MHIKNRGLFPSSQFDFHAKKSTIDAINTPPTQIYEKALQMTSAHQPYFSIGSAYDDVDVTKLYFRLTDIELPLVAVHNIIIHIWERNIYERITDKLLGHRKT